MSVKFGRTYSLSVMGRSQRFIDLAFPLTLKFNITHATFSGANGARFQIYNLGAENQKEIYWDQWIKQTKIPISLSAGYESDPNPPSVFTGQVTVAYTDRVGQDLVTYIEAMDGGYGIRNGVLDYVVPPNTPLPQVFVNAVTFGLPGVTTSLKNVVISNPTPPLTSARVLYGSAWQVVHDELVPPGGQCFIADGVASLLGMNDRLPVINNLGILNAATGLLNVPKREGTIVSCACLFEPRVKLGQTLTLQSTRAPWVNGDYQIIGFTHRGTISGVEAGDAVTDMTLLSTDTPHYPILQGPTGPATNFSGTTIVA